MPVLFHIGYPKTATTWFQESFFPRVKNYRYIHRDITNKHFFFSDSFTFNSTEVKHELGLDQSNEKLLLSSELMVTAINFSWQSGNYARVCAQKIKEVFPSAQIIIFLRNQQSLFASAYQQYLKNGGTYSLKKYLYSGRVFAFEHLLFDLMIEYYDSLFGKENVHIFFYEEFRRDPDSFLDDFCKKFDFKIDLNEIPQGRVNRGLRKGMVLPLRFFNFFHYKPIGRKNYLFHLPGMIRFINQAIIPLNRFNIFGEFLKTEDLLDQKDYEAFRNYYSVSNRRLAKRVGEDILKNYGYYL